MRGVTLIELAVVLLILIALAGMLIPYVQNTGGGAQCVATDASLVAIRDAIMGTGGQPGYLSDMGGFPKHPGVSTTAASPYSLHYLFSDWNANADPSPNTCLSSTSGSNDSNCQHLPHFNPNTQRGWRGPYLSNGLTCGSLTQNYVAPNPPEQSPIYMVCKIGAPEHYAQCGDSSCVGSCSPTGLCQTGSASSNTKDMYSGIGVALDAFSVMGPIGAQPARSPIQLFQDSQGHHYLVSAGPDGLTQLSNRSDPNATLRGDDRVLYLDGSDPWGNQPCH